ncbi:unnamed protein product, partial [Laminaria digitata]
FVFLFGYYAEGDYIVVEGMKRRHGFGKHVDGKEKYVGQWQNDSMHGEGEIRFASGASYRGYFGGNKFHGYGRYEWNDAATYEGGWRENKMHGRGCYMDREKSRWDGDFFNGLYDNGRARVALR